MIIHNKGQWALLSLLLVFCLLFGEIAYQPSRADAAAELYNDRSADIVNATPLSAGGFVLPGGLKGNGQIVGLADSGLDRGTLRDMHPDLENDPGRMPRVAMLKSYTDRAVPDDPIGHGTHMAATIVGSGKASGGKYRGIAPEAALYFQALLDSDGKLQIPDIDKLFVPAYSAGVRIHVNGWGHENNSYALLSSQIDKFVFEHPDFLPIFGAGNSGPNPGTLSIEANSKNALVVGASQVPRPAFSAEARFAGEPASSSSRGPALDGRMKPELLAPGSAVISACSRLSDSNFEANPLYTRMGGSSMAAAVSGASAALLREYLLGKAQLNQPSAALIKALLINGGRLEEGKTPGDPGILDLAGTILALQEGLFKFDNQGRVAQDEISEYRYIVSHEGLPFRATLAWSDPPAVPGDAVALVNNLDLIVKGPEGTLYYGNDFSMKGRADNRNNLEQVYIPQAPAGEYIITVRGTSMREGHIKQAFALVYGEALLHQTVKESDNGKLILLDGSEIMTDNYVLYNLGGDKTGKKQKIKPGTELYRGSKGLYLFSREWETGGIQLISTPEGMMLMEMNPAFREGGYYADSRQPANRGGITVNGLPLEEAQEFPAGARVKATVNPFYQSLWQVNAAAEEVKGYIAGIDIDTRVIRLVQDEEPYVILPWGAASYMSKLRDSSVQEAPYGYAESTDLTDLLAGMKVKLIITPGTRLVNHIQVERELVLGAVLAVNTAQEAVMLDTGKSYRLFPGTMVYRDGKPTGLEAIESGDFITGLLLPDTEQLLRINANSRVEYGRVIYFSEKEKNLYMVNHENQPRNYSFSGKIKVYRWGNLMDLPSIEPGSWVRVILAPEADSIKRIDIAETAAVSEKTLSFYDPEKQLLHMLDGSSYKLQPRTLINYGGYRVKPQDLPAGSRLRISTLLSPGGLTDSLAAVEYGKKEGVPPPELKATARSLNGVLVLQGHSTADKLTLYRQDGSRVVITPDSEGNFNRIFSLLENEASIKLIAVDSRSTGINVLETEVSEYKAGQNAAPFSDIDHPVGEQINKLAGQGIISGYGDGTFRPNQAITRLEFIKILVQQQQLEPESGHANIFTDQPALPWWGLGVVKAAGDHGIIKGYPDGTFRPNQPLTRLETAVIIDRLLNRADNSSTVITGLPVNGAILPDWGREPVSRGYERGLLPALWGEGFDLRKWVTRGEAVQLLEYLPAP